MKKKLFPIVIALLMVFAMMPMTAGTVFADNINVSKYVVNLTSGSGSGDPTSFNSQQDGRFFGVSDTGAGVANGQFFSTGQVTYIRLPDCPDTFTGQDGTVFIGWQIDGSGPTHTPGNFIEATNPMNLTAIWAAAGDASLSSLTVDKGVLEPQFSPDVTDYDVTVYCEGSPVEVIATATPAQSDATVIYGKEYSCPALSDGDTVAIKVTNGANEKVYIISVTVLYSITTEIEGNGSVKTTNFYMPELGETNTAGDENTFKLVATPSDGWKFKEWQLISGSGTLNNPTSTTATYQINKDNAVVKAIFVPTYTVTFKTDGGKWDDGTTTDREVTVEEGSAAIPPGIPTREGYEFIDWDQDWHNIESNLTVTALWRKLVNITNVNISIEAPKCGTEVELVEYAHGDYGQNPSSPHTHPGPAVTVSSDEANLWVDIFHGGSEVKGVWTDNEQGVITWETPNSGYFTGTMEGGNEYYARFSLEAVGDYVFGNDRYDVIKVNGQKPVYVSNDSNKNVVVVAKVKASHVPDSETIVKATPGTDGSIDHTCEKCGNAYSEAISAPEDFLLSKKSYTYSGSANEPSVTVKDADGNVIDQSNYTVTYKNNINAGTATATVTFKGDYYEGSKDLTFKINAKAITPAVTLSATSYTYDGKIKAPQVTVKNGTKVLTKNTDYTVTYASGRTNAGTYNVTVKMKGNYSGSSVKSFKINKAVVKVTAPTGKTFTYNGKVQTGVAAGSRFTLSGTTKATNAGSYTAKATLKTPANYTYKWTDGTTAAKTIKWTINKAANPLTMKARTATVKYSALKNKAQSLAVTKVISFTKQLKDKKTYTLSAAKKGTTSFNKYFTVNKTTGTVTVKKGLSKGTYKVTVKVKAAGSTNYKPSALKTVTFTIKVL